jgi:hypothetical protein
MLATGESAWYAKATPTFADGLAAARERIWRGRILGGSCEEDQLERLPEPLLEDVIHGLSRGA